MQNVVEITPKIAKIRDFRRFSCIGLSAGLAEYSAEHYRPILAEQYLPTFVKTYLHSSRTTDIRNSNITLFSNKMRRTILKVFFKINICLELLEEDQNPKGYFVIADIKEQIFREIIYRELLHE